MTGNRYKIIIYGKKIYREYPLSNSDSDLVKIGTTRNCQVRFNKEYFFDEFELDLMRTPSGWQLNSGESVYFTTDGVMKVYSKDMQHGDEIVVKYRKYNGEIFRINFFIDFDAVERNYGRAVDISGIQSISIGGAEKCDIVIRDPLIEKDTMTLSRKSGEYQITNSNIRYGVYVNGIKTSGNIKLSDRDFFMIVGYGFYLKDGRLYTSKDENILIGNLPFTDKVEQKSALSYPKFNRNTRVKYVLPTEEIEVVPPKPLTDPPRRNIVMTMIPALSMIALTILLRGSVGGNKNFLYYSISTMVIGVAMSVAAFILDGRHYKKELAERREKYLSYIGGKEEEIKVKRDYEAGVLQKMYRPMDFNLQTVEDFGRELFERDVKDDDFLHVRLGTGDAVSGCPVKFHKQEYMDGRDDLSDLPGGLEEKYRCISGAPIVSRFSASDAVGVVGSRSRLYDVLKDMTLDIAARHFYKDVKLFYMFGEEDCDRFAWLRWFKHAYNDDLGVRNLMYDEESRNTLLEYLYIKLSERETLLKETKGMDEEDPCRPRFVVFVFDSRGIGKHPVSKYMESCNKYGITFIFFEEHEELLPKGCTEIVRLDEGNDSGGLLLSGNGDSVSAFVYNPISDAAAEQTAIRLAPVYVDEVNLESELTRNISLFELLDIMTVDDLDLTSRWAQSKVYKSMAAPLGVKLKKKVVYLDLHEKHHGPHGLVAGTTGSGKSEILQSYILSMATLFHPYEVGFVIIDFKGGGMVNQFRDLPHLVGSITNIDGREINRSLLSIKAELRRRQEIFSKYDVNHIDQYIKLFKAGEADCPLPHLIIIVDEFAELKSEFPDFMKELISAARIGRSLGVHLILATQKPSGVVDSQIWSNSKFKLCLKVQTKEDSNEVIKTPLAAEIVEPGRAYLQVGNNEIFELFQSAYSGAKVDASDGENRKVFELYKLNLWGKKQLIYTNKKSHEDKDSKNQLQVAVDYIGSFCEKNNIKRLPGICLPPLEDVVYYNSLSPEVKDIAAGVTATVGIYDDPEQQLQKELVLNLSEGNTFIVGSAQSGKTTLLQTILYSILDSYTPSEVNAYVIDCGNMALKVFEGAGHVGGVALPNEEERILNLFKMLHNEIASRKKIFAQKSVGTFKAYKEAGFRDLPQVLLVLDNVVAFREYYPEYDTDLLVLSREGQSAGINIIATATQSNALGYKVLANFSTKVALNCNDKGEYSNLFDRCKTVPKSVEGRGLFSVDRRVVEFQTALCTKGDKEIERAESLKAFIEGLKARYGGKAAKPIPQVPEILREDELFSGNRPAFAGSYIIPAGVEYSSVELIDINMIQLGMMAVIGREKSGKTNFIKYIMSIINRTIFNCMTEAYVLDGTDRQLESVRDYGYVQQYTVDMNDAAEIIEKMASELEKRQEYLLENRGVKSDAELLKKFPLLLLVVENPAFIDLVSKNKELYAAFLKIVKQYKNLKAAVIFSNIENVAAAYNSPELLKLLKENKRAFIFDDLGNHKFFDISLKQQKEFAKPIKPGDGYFYLNGEVVKVKTVLHG